MKYTPVAIALAGWLGAAGIIGNAAAASTSKAPVRFLAPSGGVKRPNIIFVLADDMGYGLW